MDHRHECRTVTFLERKTTFSRPRACYRHGPKIIIYKGKYLTKGILPKFKTSALHRILLRWKEQQLKGNNTWKPHIWWRTTRRGQKSDITSRLQLDGALPGGSEWQPAPCYCRASADWLCPSAVSSVCTVSNGRSLSDLLCFGPCLHTLKNPRYNTGFFQIIQCKIPSLQLPDEQY